MLSFKSFISSNKSVFMVLVSGLGLVNYNNPFYFKI